MTASTTHRYKTTESKYKGGAEEMYVTYDLQQATRGEGRALYPKVQRIYIAGKVTHWQVGTFAKRTGKTVHGVKIDYAQSRQEYARKGYTAKRGSTQYHVRPAHVRESQATFSKIVEVPEEAQNVQFHAGPLPQHYHDALQNVR
jgi:hypothetical protein